MPPDLVIYGSMIEALGIALNAGEDRDYRSALDQAEHLFNMLGEDDELRVLAATKDGVIGALVACTDKEILVSGARARRIDLEDVLAWNVRKGGWLNSGALIVEEFGGAKHVFEKIGPARETARLQAIIDDEFPGDLVPEWGFHAYPPGPAVGSFQNLAVFEDRIHLPDGTSRRLSADTEARVESTGNVTTTRGRNLGNKALGTLFLGPVGLFGIGNARVETYDYRELFLQLVDPQWSWVGQFDPALQLYVRAFQGAVNAAAWRLADQTQTAADATPPAAEDPLERLERLAALRERGMLTEEEYNEQKRRLLDQV